MNKLRNVSVLVGNGLSIASNPSLNLQDITKEVLRRIQSIDGDDVVRAMKEIAERALPHGATSADDFELLVGAFGSQMRTLGILSTLAELTMPLDADLRDSIVRVAVFAEYVRDTGISHVLEVIAGRSHADADKVERLQALVRAVVESFGGQITFGNLNYDTLLLAALLSVCKSELADLGHGFKKVTVEIDNGESCTVPELRRHECDFPSDKRVRLLHLHGSLTYWASKDAKTYAKLPKGLVEDTSQWKAVRERTTSVRPVVVLANQRDKVEHVERYPFNLVYEMFANGLADSRHWIVIGYSFRDEAVNKMIRTEFLNRDPKPDVLVVTRGDDPSREVVERAFGWGAEDISSDAWLYINREGAIGLEETADWQSFISR